MTWDFTIKIADIAIVIATFFGPIMAIWAQKKRENTQEIEKRRMKIFLTMMAKRANPLSVERVDAVNSIPVEFYGRGSELKDIREMWQNYMDTLTNPQMGPQREAAYIDLLYKISKFLKYDFSQSDIRNRIYYPEGHVTVETEQDAIRAGLAKVLKGEMAIPMAVTEVPANNDLQEELQKQLGEWLSGKRSVNVRMFTDEPPV